MILHLINDHWILKRVAAVVFSLMLCIHFLPAWGMGDNNPYAAVYRYDKDSFIWYDPPDYCQWDENRWANNPWSGSWQNKPLSNSGALIGDVSCTVFSTVNGLSAILEKYIDPGKEACSLYDQGVMSSQGVDYTGTLALARKYGVSAQILYIEELAGALLEGKPVVAFTRNSVFSASDHAITLFGYKNGMTLVRDPSHPARWTEDNVGGKWYTLKYIASKSPNMVFVALGDGNRGEAEDIPEETDYEGLVTEEVENSSRNEPTSNNAPGGGQLRFSGGRLH